MMLDQMKHLALHLIGESQPIHDGFCLLARKGLVIIEMDPAFVIPRISILFSEIMEE
jgi:hypothetical protein